MSLVISYGNRLLGKRYLKSGCIISWFEILQHRYLDHGKEELRTSNLEMR